MTWIKVDDSFPEHAKALAAGDEACWLFVSSLCYAGRNLTDGFIPAAQVPRLTGLRQSGKLATALVSAGLWHEADGGFTIHEYTDYQPTKERVLDRRRNTVERVRKHRGNGVTSGDVTALARVGAFSESSPVSEVGSSEEDARGREANDLEAARTRLKNEQVRLVFDAWVTATERDSTRTKLTPDRRRRIEKALASHGLEDCVAAVTHIGADAWARGANDRQRRFDDIAHALGDGERIERWRDQMPRSTPVAVDPRAAPTRWQERARQWAIEDGDPIPGEEQVA